MESFWKNFAFIAQPLADVLITVIVPVIIVAIVQGFMRLLRYLKVSTDQKGTELERSLNAALHQSFERGIRLAMLRYGVTPELLGKMVANADKDSIKTVENILASSIDAYVKPNMSGTIEKLGVSDKTLYDIARTKIIDATKN